jgi:hypothetical protein
VAQWKDRAPVASEFLVWYNVKRATLCDNIGFLLDSGFLLHYITDCPILSIGSIMSKIL